MSSNFVVCTHDMGGKINGYLALKRYTDPKFSRGTLGTGEYFYWKGAYEIVEQKGASSYENNVDVFCLQQVETIQRPFIQTLIKKSFSPIFKKDLTEMNTMILLNPAKFTDIENLSAEIEKSDIAIARAVHKESGQRICFVSVYVRGLSYESGKSLEGIDSYGNTLCEKIAEKIAQLGPCAIQIIGADMNVSPERRPSLFNSFTERGFKVLRTGLPTNVNPYENVEQEREVDFIFTKISAVVSLWQKIKSIFWRTTHWEASIQKKGDTVEWDPQKDTSDHKPVYATVTLKTVNSTLYQYCVSAFRYFFPSST